MFKQVLSKQVFSMLVMLADTTTEMIQYDPQDLSLLERDFIIYFYNFISN